MSEDQTRLEELRRLLYDLHLRVSQLEHKLGNLSPPEGKAPSKAAPWSESSGQKPSATSPPPNIVQGSGPSPNLESLIGSHWLNRVGIVAVLVGVSLFLRYAFESQWVGPAGRVLIGLLAGIGVIVWSEWFRVHAYPVFSFSLKALGLGVLYLSLWASFQVYEQISWVVAFISMIVVTASTIAMALWQEVEILALFALVGGFATPLLLYTHESRELPLFTYIVLLNVASLILAASRPWSRLLLLSLLATVILYFAWYAVFYSPSDLALTVAFATAFFAIFAIAPLLEGVYRSEAPNSHVLLFVASFNAAAYFLELYLVVERMNNTGAWCALALSAFYAFLSRFPRTRNGIDSASALPCLHLALCTIFITLAIAIRFESHWISMAWFAEAAVLAAVGFWRRSPFVRWQALVLIAVAIAKVFAYDIWRLESGYRILGFLTLGLLLLAVSFVYQRDWLRLSIERGDENSGSVQSK